MGFEQVELMVGGHNMHLPQKPPAGQHDERWYHADGEGEARNALYMTHLPPDVGAAQTWHSALPPAWHNSTWTGNRTIATSICRRTAHSLSSAGPGGTR
ncbi:MAG: hypothetical protein ACREFN_00455 [Acetobacteraceae bacterium]